MLLLLQNRSPISHRVRGCILDTTAELKQASQPVLPATLRMRVCRFDTTIPQEYHHVTRSEWEEEENNLTHENHILSSSQRVSEHTLIKPAPTQPVSSKRGLQFLQKKPCSTAFPHTQPAHSLSPPASGFLEHTARNWTKSRLFFWPSSSQEINASLFLSQILCAGSKYLQPSPKIHRPLAMSPGK
jgi:hypothetical protein